MLHELVLLKNKIGNKKQVSDTLYCTFKEAIATGILKPGYRLKEEELAEKFLVSRTPVREAIKKLENEGLVTSDSTNGSIIRKLELDECLDTLEMLELLRNAAVDILLGRISRSLFMMMQANLKKGETLTDPIMQYDNNAEFHALLAKATGNSELIHITKRLAFKERIIVNSILPYSYSDNYVSVHRELLKAIVENDTDYIKSYKEHNKTKCTNYMNLLINKFLDTPNYDVH